MFSNPRNYFSALIVFLSVLLLLILLKIISDSLNRSISMGDNISFEVHIQWIWIVIYGNNTRDWRNFENRKLQGRSSGRYPLEVGLGFDWNKFYDSAFILHYMCVFFKRCSLDIPSDAYLSGRLKISQKDSLDCYP